MKRPSSPPALPDPKRPKSDVFPAGSSNKEAKGGTSDPMERGSDGDFGFRDYMRRYDPKNPNHE
eukprot:117606-Amorphochlora_amoeboformis.AAC.1